MTKLCARGKAAAKRKFKVYPSAYANAYASKICAGKIKDPSGVKRKDFKGPKPARDGKFFTKPGMQTKKGSGKDRFKPTSKMERSEKYQGKFIRLDVDGQTFSNPSSAKYYGDMIDG